jgi:hypothetical protein
MGRFAFTVMMETESRNNSRCTEIVTFCMPGIQQGVCQREKFARNTDVGVYHRDRGAGLEEGPKKCPESEQLNQRRRQ